MRIVYKNLFKKLTILFAFIVSGCSEKNIQLSCDCDYTTYAEGSYKTGFYVNAGGEKTYSCGDWHKQTYDNSSIIINKKNKRMFIGGFDFPLETKESEYSFTSENPGVDIYRTIDRVSLKTKLRYVFKDEILSVDQNSGPIWQARQETTVLECKAVNGI
tara:strand:- start:1471 stop:1947 length:477 start_codon:yes stop_codon:yes gene_type:complete